MMLKLCQSSVKTKLKKASVVRTSPPISGVTTAATIQLNVVRATSGLDEASLILVVG